ncbi:Apyrase [Eumeta japonica]|uniref:Apyrase n=1 Tax=Eumeta variegata TaxID=151549 RepID=A0A4C1TLB8_EUMVA|nr:Apyrase [Eumeta japonica]
MFIGTRDVSRFVETNPFGGVCNPSVAPCIGGFARLTTAVRDAMALEPDSLLLNAGDSFQGTIWYNLLRWNVTAEFMNLLPHDAHNLEYTDMVSVYVVSGDRYRRGERLYLQCTIVRRLLTEKL